MQEGHRSLKTRQTKSHHLAALLLMADGQRFYPYMHVYLRLEQLTLNRIEEKRGRMFESDILTN